MEDAKVSAIGLAKKPEPNKEVVEFLEEALARAKLGEVAGILLLEQDSNGGAVSYSTSGIKDRFRTTGFLHHAIFKLQTDNS